MNGTQRLARAERDCVDLHQALAEALRRIAIANRLLGPARRIDCRDLADVLTRLSGEDSVQRYIDVEFQIRDPLRGGFAS